MAKRAVCGAYTPVANDQDEMTLNCDVTFFNTDEGQYVQENATVPVAIDPAGLVAGWYEAVVDAIVAYAATNYSWTVPRTNVVHPTVAKGLIV